MPADSHSQVERFFVADRDVGSLAGSASLAATQMSAGTLVGTVGIHYAVGISFAAVWPGIWLGWLLSMLYIAPQLRAFGGVTVPDYLAARFDNDGAGGRRTRGIAASLIALIYFVYTAAQYVAGGVILEATLLIPRLWGMVALVAIVLVYTTVGGMRASIASDGVQVLLMLVGLVLATTIGLVKSGGPGPLLQEVHALDSSLLGLGMSPADLTGFALAFGLGVAVAPYEVSRIYAMKSPDTVRRAIRGSIAIQAVVAVCVVVLGLLARVRYPGLATPDAAVATLAESFFGPIVGSLLLLAVLAAVLSTVDSVVLVSSSALAYDLYAALLRPIGGVSLFEDDILVVSRITTVAVAVVPLALAMRPAALGGLVQLIVALYSALIAGALLVPVLLGLHWERTTTPAAIFGVLVGAVAVACWHLLTDVSGTLGPPISILPPVVVGVGASVAVVVVGSLLSPTDTG
jgi:SSS family transporter